MDFQSPALICRDTEHLIWQRRYTPQWPGIALFFFYFLHRFVCNIALLVFLVFAFFFAFLAGGGCDGVVTLSAFHINTCRNKRIIEMWTSFFHTWLTLHTSTLSHHEYLIVVFFPVWHAVYIYVYEVEQRQCASHVHIKHYTHIYVHCTFNVHTILSDKTGEGDGERELWGCLVDLLERIKVESKGRSFLISLSLCVLSPPLGICISPPHRVQ